MDVWFRRSRQLLLRTLIAWFALNGIIAAPAHAEWRRAESQHFIVYSDVAERRLREHTRRLERFRALLALYYPVDEARPAPRLHVYLVGDATDLHTAVPHVGGSVAGIYAADHNGARAVFLAGSVTVLQHEYTHHFMNQYGSGAFPAWLVEGLAEYFSTANVDVQPVRVGTADAGRVSSLIKHTSSMHRIQPQKLPLETVLTSTTWQLSRDQGLAFYAQSWLLTHYLLRDPERKLQLASYVRAIRDGADPLAAFPKAFGSDIATFNSALGLYLRNGMQFSQLEIELPEPTIEVTALPASADAVLLRSIGAEFLDRHGTDPARNAARQTLLQDMRVRLQRYPDDAYVVERVAAAEVSIGDPQRALDLLAPTLTDASSPERLYVAGSAHHALARARIAAQHEVDPVSSAALDRARHYFILVQKAQPLHYQAMFQYWQAATLARMPLTTSLQSVIVQAYNLAPQCDEIALNAGRMLAQVGRKAEAISALQGVAGDPHGGGYSRNARRLIALLRAPHADEGMSEAALDADAQDQGDD